MGSTSPWPARLTAVAVLVVAAAGFWFLSPRTMQPDWPPALANATLYGGPDAGTLTIDLSQEGCCYLEGSLRFLRLEGPSSAEWLASEHQTITVRPGTYAVTAYERGCGGYCSPGFVDAPKNFCEVELVVAERSTTDIAVTFPIPQPCRLVTSGT